MAIRETISGNNCELVSIVDPTRVYQVNYEFQIATNTVVRPGFPRVAGKSDSSGRVQTANGQPLPEGEYWLTAADGERLRVCNAGLGEWAILAG